MRSSAALLALALLGACAGTRYATLVYVWLRSAPVATVLVSPYSELARLLVVESAEQRVGQWINVRRTVVEDYRRAFGDDRAASWR